MYIQDIEEISNIPGFWLSAAWVMEMYKEQEQKELAKKADDFTD